MEVAGGYSVVGITGKPGGVVAYVAPPCGGRFILSSLSVYLCGMWGGVRYYYYY